MIWTGRPPEARIHDRHQQFEQFVFLMENHCPPSFGANRPGLIFPVLIEGQHKERSHVINIVIISDIKIYCEGLDHIFSGIGSIQVVGSVSSAAMAKIVIADTQPDVVLLDMTMAASCELAREIASISTDSKIVALAVPHDERNIVQCAEAGITGYVLREASIDELIEAVVRAAKGECYCPPKIAACILKQMQEVAASAKRKHLAPVQDSKPFWEQGLNPEGRLTRREQQIASLLFNGLSNKQIARDLSIEVSTVKNHVHNVLIKLEVKTRSQAVSLMQKTGMQNIPLPRPSGSMDLDPFLRIST